jgi:hypothetical protein
MRLVRGRVWHALGAAWATVGVLSRSIAAHRRGLCARGPMNTSGGLVAISSLGVALVVRAHEV